LSFADNARVIRKVVAMRAFALLFPLALAAAPAVAADTAPANRDFQIPPELTDPAMGDRLGKMIGVLTKSMMDVPIGEVQAAVEGRDPTAADRQRTIRDLAGGDPDLDRKVETQVARAMPKMQAGMKAMASSLPAMMKAIEQAAETMEGSLDRATANLPDPSYPRR
jgi:hypothetical protein